MNHKTRWTLQKIARRLALIQLPQAYLLVAALALASCRGPQATTVLPVSASPTPFAPTLQPRSLASPTTSPTLAPTLTATPVPPPTLTPTPDPYRGLYIDDLQAREYGGGEITLVQTLAVTPGFTRTLIAYPSDGLTIYGFMNIPRGLGPFPVIIVNHGYLDPAQYQALTYMTRYTDPLARAGFLVVHADYRGYGSSDSGPNLFRAGYAIDVLNLIALVKGLAEADPQAIGLFGHSMGGGISLRVGAVSPDVKAILLYGSMSGDENANFAKIAEWRGDPNLPELSAPPEVVARVSPINYLANIQAAVSIHHGDRDATVPPEWSADLYARLSEVGKNVEYFSYPGQPHTFVDDGHNLLIERSIAFFDRHLRQAK